MPPSKHIRDTIIWVISSPTPLCQHSTENQRANSNLSLIIPVSHFNMISGPVELTTKTTLHYTTDATNT